LGTADGWLTRPAHFSLFADFRASVHSLLTELEGLNDLEDSQAFR